MNVQDHSPGRDTTIIQELKSTEQRYTDGMPKKIPMIWKWRQTYKAPSIMDRTKAQNGLGNGLKNGSWQTANSGIRTESRPALLRAWEWDQLTVYRILSICSAQLVARGGVGGETCMNILVTSADVKPRPWKLFPRPKGLQTLSFNQSVFRSVSKPCFSPVHLSLHLCYTKL